jgi:hypothetical protein
VTFRAERRMRFCAPSRGECLGWAHDSGLSRISVNAAVRRHYIVTRLNYDVLFALVRLLDTIHQGKKPFGQRGVDVDGSLQECIRLASDHEHAENLNQLATFARKN